MASFNFALKFPDEEPFSAGWVLQHVVAPVARKLSLPFAIKCGTRRGANARLRQVGDGVSSFDVGVLNRLCTMFPDVKFLATILSMDNQRELAATAQVRQSSFVRLVVFLRQPLTHPLSHCCFSHFHKFPKVIVNCSL